MAEEETQLSRLVTSLKTIGLDEKWATAVVALCGQEIVIKKKMGLLGEEPSGDDFQKIAQRLAEIMKEKGDAPPTILLSLARAYPHLRAELVHAGHITPLKEPDVNSLVTNTSDLISALFPPIADEDFTAKASSLLAELDRDKIARRISGFDFRSKTNLVFSFIEIRREFYLSSEVTPDWEEKASKCERIIDVIGKSLGAPQLAELLKSVLERFALTEPFYVMSLISNWCSSKTVGEMLKNEGHLDWVISSFSQSGSYESAAINASAVMKLASLMTKQQLEEVLAAMDTNDQIKNSWGAQNALAPFLLWVSGKVDSELLKRVRGGFRR